MVCCDNILGEVTFVAATGPRNILHRTLVCWCRVLDKQTTALWSMSRHYSSTMAPLGRSNEISTQGHIWHCTQRHNTTIPTLHNTFSALSISLPLSLRAQPCTRTGSPVLVILDTVIPLAWYRTCLLYTSPSPRDKRQSRMPSSA